jgi:hypothetical protein
MFRQAATRQLQKFIDTLLPSSAARLLHIRRGERVSPPDPLVFGSGSFSPRRVVAATQPPGHPRLQSRPNQKRHAHGAQVVWVPLSLSFVASSCTIMLGRRLKSFAREFNIHHSSGWPYGQHPRYFPRWILSSSMTDGHQLSGLHAEAMAPALAIPIFLLFWPPLMFRGLGPTSGRIPSRHLSCWEETLSRSLDGNSTRDDGVTFQASLHSRTTCDKDAEYWLPSNIPGG